MRKQTNLAEVKLTALALLSTEINETPYSPMIVKHPFTDTGVSAIPDGKGGVEMIDLTEDDAQLRWRQSMARQIDKADNAYAIYMMVTKPYALTFLKFAIPHLSREDMLKELADRLYHTSGKKQYGYLKSDVKAPLCFESESNIGMTTALSFLCCRMQEPNTSTTKNPITTTTVTWKYPMQHRRHIPRQQFKFVTVKW